MLQMAQANVDLVGFFKAIAFGHPLLEMFQFGNHAFEVRFGFTSKIRIANGQQLIDDDIVHDHGVDRSIAEKWQAG